MRTVGKWNPFIGAALATLALYLGSGMPASAHDCVQRLVDFKNMLALPGATVEDCMRTGYVQAIVTAILASIGGLWIAQSLFRGERLPAVSKRDIIKLVKDNEDPKNSPEDHHKGVTKKIEGALKEVEVEISRLESEGSTPENKRRKVRLSALLWALSQTLDEGNKYKEKVSSPHLPDGVSTYPGGDEKYKCNKFVADAYSFGAGIGVSIKDGQTGFPANQGTTRTEAPLAGSMATAGENLRNLTMARNYDPTGNAGVAPKPGDIVAFEPKKGHHGHATIYLGNGLVVAAKPDEGATIELLDVERRDEDHIATRVRSYTGSGK